MSEYSRYRISHFPANRLAKVLNFRGVLRLAPLLDICNILLELQAYNHKQPILLIAHFVVSSHDSSLEIYDPIRAGFADFIERHHFGGRLEGHSSHQWDCGLVGLII